MKEEIQVLNDKLDILTSQMNAVTSRFKRLDDLKEDLALFSSDAFCEIIKFLSDIEFHYRTGDFLFLLKKLLINLRNISRMMDQLQSVSELTEDLGPLSKDIFNDIIEKMNKLEKEGFFKYLDSFKIIFRQFHESFSPEELEKFASGIIRLFRLLNRFSRPDYLEKLEKIADTIENAHLAREEKVSLFQLFRKVRRKSTMQNAGLILDLMESISEKNF